MNNLNPGERVSIYNYIDTIKKNIAFGEIISIDNSRNKPTVTLQFLVVTDMKDVNIESINETEIPFCKGMTVWE
ncbi:MAG: hypothetical protein LC105_12110 [Chitinophagales bacterium]|nr:hypothetical protein [Chitinophagales bacterium]MCZ2394595.1 hypothetical protein [Chitinophagales bacterium]